MDDFYEDDEPVADVLAAFESGQKHLTAGAAQGYRWQRIDYQVPVGRALTAEELANLIDDFMGTLLNLPEDEPKESSE